MCGIVGIWKEANDPAVARMAQSVAHRGPDGLDWVTMGDRSLGASRLAIFGDPTAPAIFCDPETRTAVLLNGEIYNVDELRSELISSGFRLWTNLESEIIARLYEKEGVNFIAQLKGMFALAILDRDQLILARDRFGIKPLYYARMGDRVAFASEIKALLAHPDIAAVLHIPALQEIVLFGYICSRDKTLFEGVHQVEPGTAYIFRESRAAIVPFASFPRASYLDEAPHMDYLTAVAQLRERIVQGMELLLSHGDHQVGLYLSGGVDSTTLALVARAILGRPLITFTLSDSPDSPDLLAAREVASRLGTRHLEQRVTLQDYFARLEHFVTHYECLVAGGVFDLQGGMAFHLLSETISKHVRVALSGEGADELFGGYYWIHTHPLGFADRIRRRLESYPIEPNLHQAMNRLFPLPEDERTYKRNIFDFLIRGGLANYHLQSVDRSAGAFGFEIRPPYLFDDLANFALKLPIEYKALDKRITKRILRDAFRPEFERWGLEWVLARPKEGMPAALANLAGPIRDHMESEIGDAEFSQHPLRVYFGTKADLYLFKLFSKAFCLS